MKALRFRSLPVIARKPTGGLDDTQLRNLEVRLTYLRELEERRAAVIASVNEQGKLARPSSARNSNRQTARLVSKIFTSRTSRSAALVPQIAREAGLEPLADGLLGDPSQAPDALAATFVNAEKGIADVKAALDGARAILMERWGENAALIGDLRTWLSDIGVIHAKVVEGRKRKA